MTSYSRLVTKLSLRPLKKQQNRPEELRAGFLFKKKQLLL